MSLDYPFYEELKRRKHKAAKWWLIGDILYYLGLLPALLILLIGIPYLTVRFFLGWSWEALLYLVIGFVAGGIIFYIGASLKGYSYKLASNDGINPSDY
jgi:hypothetical protein